MLYGQSFAHSEPVFIHGRPWEMQANIVSSALRYIRGNNFSPGCVFWMALMSSDMLLAHNASDLSGSVTRRKCS